MKTQPLFHLVTEVTARGENNGKSFRLLLKVGPFTFSMSETEGYTLANQLADAIEGQRVRRDQETDQ